MKHSRQAGFTLLEVLLVAMLMGLVATAVTLSMGGARGIESWTSRRAASWPCCSRRRSTR